MNKRENDRDWMSGFGGGNRAERPITASQNNASVMQLEQDLKNERRNQKRYIDEIESLKKEIHKANFQAFTQNTSNVSVTEGRLPAVPGVREITENDLQFGDQIGQGGFSVIYKGFLNGTPVAIKKIFDPKITDDLLAEI